MAFAIAQHVVEVGVVEGGFDRVLAVVEVPPYPEDGHIVPALGDHLLSLDVGYSVGREEDGDAGALPVGEALQGGFAGVARGGHQHQVVGHVFASRAPHGDSLGEEAGHAL
jgi:hypothetical protein